MVMATAPLTTVPRFPDLALPDFYPAFQVTCMALKTLIIIHYLPTLLY